MQLPNLQMVNMVIPINGYLILSASFCIAEYTRTVLLHKKRFGAHGLFSSSYVDLLLDISLNIALYV